jgi:hypothetical protein
LGPRDVNIFEEKRQFDKLSETDKLAYLEQAFSALQIFDCGSYDTGHSTTKKIKEGTMINFGGVHTSAEGVKGEASTANMQ